MQIVVKWSLNLISDIPVHFLNATRCTLAVEFYNEHVEHVIYHYYEDPWRLQLLAFMSCKLLFMKVVTGVRYFSCK